MGTLRPINPLEYITDRDPLPESVLNVSAWFKTETLELTFGEYVGRPNEFVDLHKSDLMYYLGNGWYVDSVLSRGSDGNWSSTAYASAAQSGRATSQNDAKANSAAASASGSGTGSVSTQSGKAHVTVTISGQEMSVGSTASEGVSESKGSSVTTGTSSTTTQQDGGPYWAAWSKIRLKRRRMQSEAVLKDMIASFTKAYNEGRQINDERYDELVSLYAIMLARTEEEANALAMFSPDDFKDLAKMLTDAIKAAMERFAKSVENLPDNWMQSRIDEINRKFDALIGTTKAKMVTEGTFNSTVWPTTMSGIERERQYALNNLKDDMVTLRVEVYGKIASMTADVGQKLLDCEIRIIEAQQKQLLGPTEVRNTVFKWMLDFMERRDDDYPGLDQLVTVADRLGYADGGMAAPTS
jgi:hypothetical protein